MSFRKSIENKLQLNQLSWPKKEVTSYVTIHMTSYILYILDGIKG